MLCIEYVLFISPQDIFLVFDKNKTQHLEYNEIIPSLKAAGRTETHRKQFKITYLLHLQVHV